MTDEKKIENAAVFKPMSDFDTLHAVGHACISQAYAWKLHCMSISIGDEGDEEIRLWLEAARSFSADVISLAASLCSLAGSVDAAIGESEERLAYRHILRSGGFAGEA